jgi:hypothetical protein
MAGSIAGALLRDVPKAPKYNVLDFAEEQRKQAQANQESLQYLEPLARDVNRFMREETTKSLRESLPGAYEKIQENISAALQGQLPSDVEQYIGRKSAEEGIAGGTSGSKFNKYDQLRNLGIASLQRTDFGIDAAERWMQMSRSPVMDITSGFVPIQQRMNIRLEEQRRLFERQWLRNKLSSIPQGAEAGLIALFDNIEETGQSVLSMYAGSMIGGGKGGGMGGGGAGGGGGGSGGGTADNSQWMNWGGQV